jgi:hypothetical protein
MTELRVEFVAEFVTSFGIRNEFCGRVHMTSFGSILMLFFGSIISSPHK